jgi:pimeloyl-ACP methyl ester carboxylesterase
MTKRHEVTVTTLDRLKLAATLVEPEPSGDRAVVLVHGGGVTRQEGGFFARLADGLAAAGVASLRFDLRGHGQSEGRMEELTLGSVLNDIRVALAQVRETTGAGSVSLLGASFGGGICAYYAAKRPEEIARLVLLNPQFNYKRRTIDNTPFWEDDHLKPEAAAQLDEQGYIAFNPSLRHGRAIFHEVFWFDHSAIPRSRPRHCLVHGTKGHARAHRVDSRRRCQAFGASIGWWRKERASSRCTRTRSTSIPGVRNGRASSSARWPVG